MAQIVEVHGDIFQSEYLGLPNCMLAHCISSDYALGAGIAKKIEERFRIKHILKEFGSRSYPDCLATGKILNLVTKDRYWMKPNYESFTDAIIQARNHCLANGIDCLIMPKIGCGLDKLNWNMCRSIIENILVGSGINCIVYYL